MHPLSALADQPSTEMHSKHADSGILSSPEESSSYRESREDDPLIPVDTRTAEKQLVRKLDRRILPITCVLYLFACESLTLSKFDCILSHDHSY